MRLHLTLSLVGLLAQASRADCGSNCQAYESARAELVSSQQHLGFDSGVALSPLEQQAATVLLNLRNQEAHLYDPRQQYHAQQAVIESSRLFQALKRMPKGAILHLHSLGSIGLSVAALQRPDCYVTFGSQFVTDGLHLAFNASGSPLAIPNTSAWARCSEQIPFDVFQERVRAAMVFTSPNTSVGKDSMWVLFDQTIRLATSAINYVPYWEQISCSAFTELAEDGVSHVELRLQAMTLVSQDSVGVKVVGPFKKADGSDLSLDDTIEAYLAAQASCKTGIDSISFVIAVDRDADHSNLRVGLEETLRLQRKYGPEVILGFDIDDAEDRYHTIAFYAEQFVQTNLSFFFHAGETRRDLHGLDNVFSALALNASRVGHGFSLRDNPALQRVMAARGVGLEVCPLSNQILRLVKGLDDHPAYGFAAAGVPVSLSPDDPIIYDYIGVTPDYVSATWAWNLTLPWIKQAAMNSMLTAAGPARHPSVMGDWGKRWAGWIQWMVSSMSSRTHR